jgi:hypothetical protein
MIQRACDVFNHAREIGIDIRILESENPESLRSQERVANLIRPRSLRHSVLTAICFDDQMGSETNEVDDVGADWGLPSEMEAEGFQLAQLHPQLDFLQGETLAKRTGLFVCQGTHHRAGRTFS